MILIWHILFVFYTFNVVNSGTFTVDYTNHTFVKDGKPWKYISASIHYFRIHPDYWQDRLQRVRAIGLNAIQIYIPWNLHEPIEGTFDFAGIANISHFLTIAQQNGLNVLLRPGPFIDAEWDYGGLPWWLIKYDEIKIRTSDPVYISKVQNYYTRLLAEIQPFLYKNNGPILTIQVENEFGWLTSCDHNYTTWLRDFIWSKLGNDVVLYTTDSADRNNDTQIECGSVPGTVTTVDFQPGSHSDLDIHFQLQDKHSGGAPHTTSEFYTDWFLNWGVLKNNERNIATYIDDLHYIYYDKNGNANIYRIITSYWVNGPIQENGDTTPFYYAIRSYIANISGWENPPLAVPPNNSMANYGTVTLKQIGTNLVSTLAQLQESTTQSIDPLSFEAINHGYGYVLYTTTLTSGGKTLSTPKIRDYGYVFINNIYQGMLSRDYNTTLVLNNQANAGDVLRILVENRGRQDFDGGASAYVIDSKGLWSGVTIDGKNLQNWFQAGIKLTKASVDSLTSNQWLENEISVFEPGTPLQPGVYTGQFTANPIQDTYLDTTGWGKGQLFINGYNLGRYWPTYGPQITLYIPKPFLQQQNTIILIELNGATQNTVNLIDHPIFIWKQQ